MAGLKLDSLIKVLDDCVRQYQSEFLNYFNPDTLLDACKYTGLSGSLPEDYFIEKKSFKIGEVLVANPVISAPLAGISDNTYRIFAKAFGSALNYTEMISSHGLYYDHRESFSLACISDFEKPCGIQLFGSEPGIMVEAAAKVEEYADFIDINMGCPVPKVIRTKSGGYLLKDEKRISEMIKKMTSSIKKPITVKVRLGWDKNSINVIKVAKIAEYTGASAIAVHGRTVRQGFSGSADYGAIKKVKEGVKIPVIISGDINDFPKARNVIAITGCDGVMIGRAAKGAPWLFFNIAAGFSDQGLCRQQVKTGKEFDCYRDFYPSIKWRKDLASLYLGFMVYFKGEEKAVKEFRKFAAWIFKGCRGISRLKQGFFSFVSMDDAIEQIDKIKNI